MSEAFTYEVKDKITVIRINLPDALGSMTTDQYIELGKLMEEADKEEDTVVTMLESTGRFFSSGANTNDPRIANADMEEVMSHEFWFHSFIAKNVFLTDTFHNHSKVLIAALNGPVIGLSSALVCFCDMIYVRDGDSFFMTTPFSNLGLPAEGASSATIYARLGQSLASELILFARPLKGEVLSRVGFINHDYKGKYKTSEEFNEAVEKDVLSQFEELHYPSILANKQLLKINRDTAINAANSKEAMEGFNRWINGVPQERFMLMAQRRREKKKSKM
ncbi:3,2-trans-enoyl-CoA isomerase [Diutina catenulata]